MSGWLQVAVVFVGSPVGLQYVVDFAPELYEIITETKYMEQLGFHVPELARNVSLQVHSERFYRISL